MVNFSSLSRVAYFEEQCLGGHLQPGLFYDQNSFCLVSGTDILSFDLNTGQRLDNVKRHLDKVIGIHFHQGMLISITDAPEVYIWEANSKMSRLRRKVRIPVDGYRIVWSYELDGEIYMLATSCEKSEETSADSVLLKFALSADELVRDGIPPNDNGTPPPIISNYVAFTGHRPLFKRHLDIGKGFYVKCLGKRVILTKFGDHSSDGTKNAAKDRLSDEFLLKSHFQVEDQRLVEFDSVKISGESLFCTVNIGRVYCWSKIATAGLSTSNCSHVTLTGHRMVVEVTAYGTMFVGTGNGLLLKYNIAGTSGAGRWHKLEQLSLQCPVRALMLSADFAHLVAILSDNSVCIIRASSLCPNSEVEALKMPTVTSVGILRDPLNSQCLFTNSKIGCFQWIDLLRWKTINEADISEENVPPEDTFNRPDFHWLNVYLVCLSIPRIVTCEYRRNDLQKTYLKFWRRSSVDLGQLEMENCVVISRRVSFVRSTLDEFWECSAVTVPMANGQQFLVIFSDGEMEIYIRNESDKGSSIWRRDLKRREQNWQQFEVKHCSSISRSRQQFATVNLLNDNSRLFLWSLTTLSVVKVVDKLSMPKQAEWSALQSSVLIVACHFGIVSFDSDSVTFIWAIHQPGMTISSTHLATFAYDDHTVYVIDASNGTLSNGLLRFSNRQQKIVAVGEEGNVWFVGMAAAEEGFLSVLKSDLPPSELTSSSQFADSQRHKRTAFGHLMALNGHTAKGIGRTSSEAQSPTNGSKNSIMLLQRPSIKQFVDGPAHSLLPIAQLARQFVHACLARKSVS